MIVRTTVSGGQSRPATDVLAPTATRQLTPVLVGSPPTAQVGSPLAAPSTTAGVAANDRAHVANTDGQGVVLRASPREDDRTPRGFMDGAAVTVLERRGADWARVRGDDGQEGWVPVRYLGP